LRKKKMPKTFSFAYCPQVWLDEARKKQIKQVIAKIPDEELKYVNASLRYFNVATTTPTDYLRDLLYAYTVDAVEMQGPEVTEITMEGADWVAIAAGGMAEPGGIPTNAFRILRVIVHFDDLWDLLITMSKQDWRKESGKEF